MKKTANQLEGNDVALGWSDGCQGSMRKCKVTLFSYFIIDLTFVVHILGPGSRAPHSHLTIQVPPDCPPAGWPHFVLEALIVVRLIFTLGRLGGS